MRRLTPFAVGLGLLLGAASGGCSNPCDKLLDKVCACPGERAKAACAEAKAKREAQDKAKPDEGRCRAQLETFSCTQLN